MHEIFTQKESRLNSALSKVQNKLDYLAENQSNLPKAELDLWNNWHDLKDRITNRLWDNWSDFKDWHWEQFGYNSY